MEVVGWFRAGHVELLGEFLLIKLAWVGRPVARWKIVSRDGVGRREHGMDVPGREAAGHEPERVHPLLLAALVLEPHLDHPHRQLRVLRQLLPNNSRRLWRLVEHGSQGLELLGGDVRPRASPLPVLALLLLVLLLILLVRLLVLI